MSEHKYCRICVRKGVKMYAYDRFNLKLFYKEITGSKISRRDCLPKWFCFECAALLHKYHEFKKRCRSGQQFFMHLLESKVVMERHLNPHLEILTNNNNKIKTYTIRHGELENIANKTQTFTQVYVDDLITEKENDAKIFEQNDNDFDDSFINDDDSSDKSNDSETKLHLEQLSHSKPSQDTVNNSENKLTDNTILNQDLDNKSYELSEVPDIEESVDIKRDANIKMESNIESDLNKFQRSVKKKFLDENHWRKITLSDEEATRRFKAKALEQKYLKADFKCIDCYRTFSQEDMMKRHIKLRHCESLGPHECRHCRMRFKWKSRLQKHLKEHYTIYNCLRCELSFPVEISAFQHDYSHNGVTWTCAHCGQGFRHSSTYYTHLRKHKSKYVCTLCGVSFVSEFGLFMHRRVKHVINEDSKEENSNTYCKVCDVKFDTLKGYEGHFAESALHATEITEGVTSLPLKTRCTKRRVPRIATNCNICVRSFSTYAAFSKHHACAHPGVPLPRARDRQDGQRQICEVCGVTLASSWSLLNHLNTHTRVQRHTCRTCGLQLSSRSVLQRHLLTHSSDKSFVCEVCDKRFSHRSGLRLHLRAHERDVRPRRHLTYPHQM